MFPFRPTVCRGNWFINWDNRKLKIIKQFCLCQGTSRELKQLVYFFQLGSDHFRRQGGASALFSQYR